MLSERTHNCTPQVRKLLQSDPKYRREYDGLDKVLKDKSKVSSLRRHGYGYLVTLWYQTARRECGRDGFADMTEFALHVGPRLTRRHQLHRLDNSRPYEPGNLRWEPQSRGGVQALVKSNTRPHRWGGKRLSHAELAALIGKRTRLEITEGAIAKKAQRYRKTMPTAHVTEAIVKSYGLAFDRSPCPLENWDFPGDMKDAAYAYAQYHNGQTRLDFAIGWMTERAEEAVRFADDDRAERDTQELCRQLAKHFAGEIKVLERKRSELLRLKAEQAAIKAGSKFREVSASSAVKDPIQPGLFDEPRDLPGLQAQEDSERYPTLDETIESLSEHDPALATEIRDVCAAARHAGLPHPYKHHPHYRYPIEGPPPGALEAARRAMSEVGN